VQTVGRRLRLSSRRCATTTPKPTLPLVARPLPELCACADNREEAEKKFQEISQAYERLMTTDEDQKVEQLAAV
jgi:hypothetical protein